MKISAEERLIRELWKDENYRANASSAACTICGLDYRQCHSRRAGLKCEPA